MEGQGDRSAYEDYEDFIWGEQDAAAHDGGVGPRPVPKPPPTQPSTRHGEGQAVGEDP